METSYKTQLKDIDTFVFDVDGVLTDGNILVTTEGELLRKMNMLDGFAIRTAVDAGYAVCIISGGKNEGVRKRLQNLGVTDIHLGVQFKEEALDEYMDIYEKKASNTLYMGDDLPDIPAMKRVGLPVCPQNAVAEVKAISRYVSHRSGGEGCVREVIEQVLKVRGDWPAHD
ncbi:KdsC family phosphatase [Zeaxanthinibacter enoshimensis]|uniref:KdsC family phosphatase n=1 Tax=Zeaxanthinibacter enoshimensis TaxID=392009 RepID=UPI0035669423